MNAMHRSPQAYATQGHMQKLRARLKRIRAFVSPGSGFTDARSALVGAVEELEALLPELSQHVAHSHGEAVAVASEQDLAESRSQLRELQALLDSGHRLLESGSSGNTNTMAQALNAYLVACIDDLIRAVSDKAVEESASD